MLEGDFWNLIEKSKEESQGSLIVQADLLINGLELLSEADIVDFEEIRRIQMSRAYTWDLWAAAYIINCGCSDDGFSDFRGWLIAQGKEIFEKILEHPDSLANFLAPPASTQFEQLHYVAIRAYRSKTRHEMPKRNDPTLVPAGESWSEDRTSLEQRCPQLFSKFWDCSSSLY